jgi:phage shock protein A
METKKEIYQQKAQARIDQMEAKINELRARFNEAKADAKMKVSNQFEDLTSRQETVENKIDQMKDAGEDAWKDMRSGLDTAMDELESSFNEAANQFEKAIS